MCGIVGYFGPKEPRDVIVEGLRKLEYRGYDSAGVAIFDGAKFKTVRAPGKLKELENKLQSERFGGRIGIGHTRWATHGVPNETNAHPHSVDGVCIIANGIIENYQQIREEMIAKGRTIKSDTDSELVAHLLVEELKRTPDLTRAVQKVYGGLRGAFAILVVWDQAPDQIVAFKHGPPLVVGLGQGEMVIASDVQAIVAHTRTVAYLEDGEMAVSTKGDVKFFTMSGTPVQKKTVEITWDAKTAEKAGYKHFMLKEIFEQPRTVASALEPHLDLKSRTIRLGGISEAQRKTLATVDRILIVACGTSFYAGMIGEYLIEQLARVPVEVEFASEFRYRNPVIGPKSLVVVVSQSGETADTLAALKLAKESGAQVLSVVNVPNSTIDRESHIHLYMNSGPEVGVASTKALTSTMAVLSVLAADLAKAHGRLNREEELDLFDKLLLLPSQMEAVLSYDSFFDEAAQTLKQFKGFLYIGRGVSFPVALEGALKLKELAYMHAEGYAAGEMKHGPIALIDKSMGIVVVAPDDHVFEKTLSNLEEVRARGGQVIAIGTGENKKLKDVSLHYLAIPETHWALTPLLSVLPVQLMSYHVADELGYDVDQPRNLAKSVTVE